MVHSMRSPSPQREPNVFRERLLEHLLVGANDEDAAGDAEEGAKRLQGRCNLSGRAAIKLVDKDNESLRTLAIDF